MLAVMFDNFSMTKAKMQMLQDARLAKEISHL